MKFSLPSVPLLALALALGSMAAAPCTRAETKTTPLAAALQPFVDKQELAGAVMLVADKDKVLTIETVGWSDIAAKRPMTRDATFWIASMTKPITAAAFMILVDEGKVKMDDPVTKYLPEFNKQLVIVEKTDDKVVLQKPKQPILLRHLLSHTSGMAFSSAIEVPSLDMLPLETVVRSYAAEPLLHQPNSKYLYSNEGINTAGRIIEVVSGMSYQDFMQKRLFDPLGMKDTTFWPTEAQLSRLAKTYKPNAAKNGLEESRTGYLHYPLSEPRREPMPGGGLFSTAEDVARFAQMVLNKGAFNGQKILSEESVKEMTSRQTPENLKDSYGYGFTVTAHGFGHGGALSTNLNIAPGPGLIGIYLVQHQGFPGAGKNASGVFSQTALKLFSPAAREPK